MVIMTLGKIYDTFLLDKSQVHHPSMIDGSALVAEGKALKTTIKMVIEPHILTIIASSSSKFKALTSLITLVAYFNFFMSSIVGNRSPKTESTYKKYESNKKLNIHIQDY